MKRNNNLSYNLKDHIFDGKNSMENYYYNNKNIFKNSCEYYSSNSRNPNWEEDDYMGHEGFSWPPRSYICSFCKREFRSAQALGGHMNVHRRDRARLRLQSPPTPRDINLNLLPFSIPNPNFTASTATSTLPSLISPSISSCSLPGFEDVLLRSLSSKGSDLIRTTTKAVKPLFAAREFDVLAQERKSDNVVIKEAEFMGLELGIGLHSRDFKEDLDLELRLGYSLN